MSHETLPLRNLPSRFARFCFLSTKALSTISGKGLAAARRVDVNECKGAKLERVSQVHPERAAQRAARSDRTSSDFRSECAL